MFFLKGGGLRVAILDPVPDRGRLGSRYCAGGYIWQVEDDTLGPLLTGPCVPEKANGFDGQGAPEVFEIALGADEAKVGGEVCVLGVGTVRRDSPVRPFHVRDNPVVTRFTDWKIEAGEQEIRMRTRQEFGGYGLELTRTVGLQGREIVSRTELRNQGRPSIPLRWFAHPFFPWTERLCRFSLECGVPSNPGFFLGDDGFLRRHENHDWNTGWFQPLQLSFGYPLRLEQRHPLVGSVEVGCDFPLAWMPVWGNALTFSFEPYFHTVVDGGARAEWAVRYRF